MRDIDDYEHFWINSEKSISPYACNKIYHIQFFTLNAHKKLLWSEMILFTISISSKITREKYHTKLKSNWIDLLSENHLWYPIDGVHIPANKRSMAYRD